MKKISLTSIWFKNLNLSLNQAEHYIFITPNQIYQKNQTYQILKLKSSKIRHNQTKSKQIKIIQSKSNEYNIAKCYKSTNIKVHAQNLQCIINERQLQLYLKSINLGLILNTMDSGRTQPLVNNYPNVEQNNVIGQPQNYPPQNQGWNQNQNQNNQWQNNPQPPFVQPGNQPMNQGYNQGGYVPQPNQGFNNNVQPNYGQQPMMPGQQPMPNLQPDKIVIIREHSSMPCRMCGFDGMSTWRQSAGCATYSWCICLFICFWPLLWLPFCMDSCYDTEVLCSRCGQVKASIPANCC